MRSSVCCIRGPLRLWWLLKAQLRWCMGHQLSRPLLTEVQLDIFRCLDRFDLDAVQLSSPQLRNFVEVQAAYLPIRNVKDALVCLREGEHLKETYIFAGNGRRLLTLSTKKRSIEDIMCFLMEAVQDAYVRRLSLFCSGAGPLSIGEEVLAMTAAKASNVTVGWLEVAVWAPEGALAEVFAIATSFPRVGIVSNGREPSSATFECALRVYASRSVALPDMRRDGCGLFAAADASVHGYCFSSCDTFLEDVNFDNKKFLVDEFVSGLYVFARGCSRIFIHKRDVPAEQNELEKYASKRVPSTTNDHISFLFDETHQEHFISAFKAQICLHDGRLTFRYTSDPSDFGRFLVCKGTPKPIGA